MRKRMFQFSPIVATILIVFLCAFLACDESEEETENMVSSRAYKGHENDVDANNLVQVYPAIVGTRLDDCQSCHTGKIEAGKQTSNACDYCHSLMLQDTGHTFMETLNPFGLDYYNAGRSQKALESIKDKDSDGDGAKNGEEIEALRYPGSELSKPGQPLATMKTVTMDQLKGMTSHTQFMLSNTSKQQFDDYATYKGVKVKDLLANLGISLDGAKGITVIAPDGFAKSFSLDVVNNKAPQPLFYSGLDTATLGEKCGFVSYPKDLPQGLSDGGPIPGEHWLMLAYERDGIAMDRSYLEASSGKIIGEGPYRIAVPQATVGKPDRGLSFSPSGCNDGFDYDDKADHNAGAMVRGVMAIRIDPMPVGVEEFDYMNGGWAYIDRSEVLIYGLNVK